MPQRRWYDVVRASTVSGASGDAATIRIYGDIGQSWWDDDATSAADFVEDLDELGNVSQIDLRLNSPGGEVFDGVTIMNALKEHPAKVVVHVDGLAASAASIIAMAGDEIIMGRGTQMMIHDASTFAWGNGADLRKTADELDSLSNSMAAVYAERAGGTAGEWRAVMQAETWYGADEAVAAKLADTTSATSEPDPTDPPPPDDDDEDADPKTVVVVPVDPEARVAAMLRASRVARQFRYQGRAKAPAPPIKRARNEERMTEEQLEALRTSLGLDANADEDKIVSTVAEVMEEFTKEPDDEPAAASAKGKGGVAGAVMLDRAAFDELRADAAAGRQAREEQVRSRREAAVDKAIREGKVLARSRPHWLKQMEVDEEGTVATFAELEAVVPLKETGYDHGGPTSHEDSEGMTLDEVRKSPLYTGWKVGI